MSELRFLRLKDCRIEKSYNPQIQEILVQTRNLSSDKKS
jgi:hypothetical protein